MSELRAGSCERTGKRKGKMGMGEEPDDGRRRDIGEGEAERQWEMGTGIGEENVEAGFGGLVCFSQRRQRVSCRFPMTTDQAPRHRGTKIDDETSDEHR
jgi:hypothetical protein